MLKQVAYEAFLRRWALSSQQNFLLKGSFLTQQYFHQRVPNDLDFVCLKHCELEQIQSTVCAWLNAITTTQLEDNVKFITLDESDFWWNPEYEMADDFPTITYFVFAEVDDSPFELEIDVSFNLNIIDAPVPIHFKPSQGQSFEIRQTASVALQVAWKLHQTMVNPRYKDILDLIHLLPYIKTKQQHDVIWETLEDECKRDNIDLNNYLDKNKLLFQSVKKELEKTWQEVDFPVHPSYSLSKKFDVFWNSFSKALIFSGLLDDK